MSQLNFHELIEAIETGSSFVGAERLQIMEYMKSKDANYLHTVALPYVNRQLNVAGSLTNELNVAKLPHDIESEEFKSMDFTAKLYARRRDLLCDVRLWLQIVSDSALKFA